ncbi:MAG: sugar transferase [Planctomycetes bacterium]|nr:sugar transferase [Planctomycetota bacterium]
MHPSTRRAKRCLDVVVSTAGLLLGLPLLPPIALAIKLTSRGPVLHRSARVGVQRRDGGSRPHGGQRLHDVRGRLFMQLRFRVLGSRVRARVRPGEHPRLTLVGKLLRRTGLEGWPQLLNVLTGRMSLVGPRPVPPTCVERLEREGIAARVPTGRVRPGMFGLTQLSWERPETFFASLCERLVFDRHYLRRIEAASPTTMLLLDLSIMTACIVRHLRPAAPGGRDVIRITYPARFGQLDLDPAELAERRPGEFGSEVVREPDGTLTAWWYPPRRRPVELPAPDGNLVASLSDSVRRRAAGVLVLDKALRPSGRPGVDELALELPRGLHDLHAVCEHLEPLWTALAERASDPAFATTMTVLLVDGLATAARLDPVTRGTPRPQALRASVRIASSEVRLELGEATDLDPVVGFDPELLAAGEALTA